MHSHPSSPLTVYGPISLNPRARQRAHLLIEDVASPSCPPGEQRRVVGRAIVSVVTGGGGERGMVSVMATRHGDQT